MSEQEVAIETSRSTDKNEDKQVATCLPSEIQTKHPLQNIWKLWYYKHLSENFEKNLFPITSVDSVEDFWGLFNHIEFASNLSLNCAYYFFKEGIRPMWEDNTNKNGGRIFTNVKKVSVINEYWLEMLLCMIGEGFGEYNDGVSGGFVLMKKSYSRVGIWTKDAANRDVNMQIGQVFKQRIAFNGTLNFESHDYSKRICYQI